MPRRSSVTPPALAVASAGLMVAANEPMGLGPLAWVALAPLFVAVWSRRSGRRAAALGLLWGLVFFGIHVSWIFTSAGWMAWAGLVVALSAYVAGATAIVSVVRRFPLAPILAAASWVALELLRDAWPFGGFPWGAVGTSQAGVPVVRTLAAAVGTYGLSFLCAFVAAVVADALRNKTFPLGSIVLVVAVAVLFVAVDLWRFAGQAPTGTVRIAAVQPSVPRPVRSGQDEHVFSELVRLTEELAADVEAGREPRPDIVVWPESAIGFLDGPEPVDAVRELARRLEAPMLVGRTEARFAEGIFLNTVLHVGADGHADGLYVKQHPVPFGEYVPIGFLRRYVSTLEQVPLDMASGPGPVVFDVGGTSVASPICFESVFPRDVRRFARLGPELIVVSTNDSSFERSAAADQHLAHSRMRAAELRQPVVQAGLAGITTVVAPDGSTGVRLGLFEQEILTADVQTRPARSLYWRVGDLFSYGWTAGLLFTLLAYWAVRRWPVQRGAPDQAERQVVGRPVA